MAKRVDQDVLTGFLEEARSYLPIILQKIETFQADPKQLAAAKEAFRYAHTIKGSASMIDLPGLSLIASHLEEALEDFISGKLKLGKLALRRLQKLVTQIEAYLDGMVSGELNEQRLIEDATFVYRRIYRLPKDGDKNAVKKALLKITKETVKTAKKDKEPEPSTPVDEQFYEGVSPE